MYVALFNKKVRRADLTYISVYQKYKLSQLFTCHTYTKVEAALFPQRAAGFPYFTEHISCLGNRSKARESQKTCDEEQETERRVQGIPT